MYYKMIIDENDCAYKYIIHYKCTFLRLAARNDEKRKSRNGEHFFCVFMLCSAHVQRFSSFTFSVLAQHVSMLNSVL